MTENTKDIVKNVTVRLHRGQKLGTLIEEYKTQVKAKLMTNLQYQNVMQVPKLDKIVINMGVGEAKENSKVIENAALDLATISGQKPVIISAKKSVASFKLRSGMKIGCKVTLRGKRMYDFFEKLVKVVLPRVRDFRGLSVNSFDGHGNYSFGIKEQIVFPEIEYDKVDKIRGMDIILVTTANTDREAEELLRLMGFPFKRAVA